jgi:hypothetical protein
MERHTWKAKYGCRSEVIKLVVAAVEELGLTPRVYTYVHGPHDLVMSYVEFETEEDQKKFRDRDRLPSQPAYDEWHKKEFDLVESYWFDLFESH